MDTRIAVATAAVVCAALALVLWWTPPHGLWAILRIAHRVFMAGKAGALLATIVIGAATWLWLPSRQAARRELNSSLTHRQMAAHACLPP